ncbi:hypothetical protein BURPS1106B_A0517 [Burkholderia pseudomallei 1106b]|uniref:Uncharacterized protein n=3 Tax=pseudomallei group TaxID=111527 RepID=A2S492_BURM9|nr:hypothetical protein BMA10229_A0771 [Burkholderia mallei NCTC 10229]ABN81629.1 hypothetical protein BURPS668_1254 [Burkholderia pseudomallei 668]ABN92298.1 hypothetical protein BURPS1106A_1262 [Burkholderia pseudomallei 1106a]ACQ95245.1 conserved hypothetical protein [Burkholderia pseudomallei MSHR346]AFR15194.1 hypothetical protein BPC006_I1309 [Burkholderia pseudomallei BPC006]EBA44801.1 hypothetical protein BURPS305_8034 [Burkholderia pseudomallei 305]EDS84598.1 hypothetical protein BUR
MPRAIAPVAARAARRILIAPITDNDIRDVPWPLKLSFAKTLI